MLRIVQAVFAFVWMRGAVAARINLEAQAEAVEEYKELSNATGCSYGAVFGQCKASNYGLACRIYPESIQHLVPVYVEIMALAASRMQGRVETTDPRHDAYS